jgi:hypothetical protein
MENFAAKGYRYIDLQTAMDPYASRPLADLYQKGGHFTPLGYNIVAKFILAQLRKSNLLDPATVAQALGEERSRIVH